MQTPKKSNSSDAEPLNGWIDMNDLPLQDYGDNWGKYSTETEISRNYKKFQKPLIF